MRMPENGKFRIFHRFQTIFSTFHFGDPLREVFHIEKFHCNMILLRNKYIYLINDPLVVRLCDYLFMELSKKRKFKKETHKYLI